MSDDSSTKDLKKKYKGQLPTVARDNYHAPTGREDTFESVSHHGDPMCYGCCGTKCLVSFIAILAVIFVCCSYVSQDGQCCTLCYWPF